MKTSGPADDLMFFGWMDMSAPSKKPQETMSPNGGTPAKDKRSTRSYLLFQAAQQHLILLFSEPPLFSALRFFEIGSFISNIE
jgi:hypothetical protein